MARRAALPFLLGSALLGAAACDTNAVGIEDCRDIEVARCRAASGCDLGLSDERDVETCERYARDHCLHGLPLEESPRRTELRACIAAIERAGACATAKGAATPAKACGDVAPVDPLATLTACDAIASPEELTACQFLTEEPPPEPEPEPKDAGGD